MQDSNLRGQDFFNVDVRSAGLVDDERFYHNYRQMYETFSSKGLNIKDIEGLQGEDGGEHATDDAPGAQGQRAGEGHAGGSGRPPPE